MVVMVYSDSSDGGVIKSCRVMLGVVVAVVVAGLAVKIRRNTLQKIIDEELLKAASGDDTATITKLLDEGANMEVIGQKDDERGLKPIHLAAWSGKSSALRILLSRTINREAEAQGKRAVHFAAIGGHVNALTVLKDGMCNLNARTSDGFNALHLAADNGNMEAVKWLVEVGKLKVDEKNKKGQTAGQLARHGGYRAIYSYLKSKTPVISTRIPSLAEAAADGDEVTLESLLEQNSSLDRPSTRVGEEGLIPYQLAAWGGHTNILKRLIEEGSELEFEAEGSGYRAVHLAAIGGHLEALKILSDAGCDLHALSSNGSSALHLAADNGNFAAVKWLVEVVKINLNLTNAEGYTAKHLARAAKYVDVTKFLMSKNPIKFADYTMLELLGCGGFGEAYLVQKGHKKRVLKVIEHGPKERNCNMAEMELQFMKNLSHPHIVAYKEGKVAEDTVFIMTEYCANGDLLQRIRKNKRKGTKIKEEKILKWCVEVASALQYIHKKQIIHRDVKPNNIFLKNNDVAKLGDFGVAKSFTDDLLPSTRAGTRAYMSPEVSREEPYDTSTDMWSLGCCLYELAALREICLKTEPRTPEGYSAEYKELVQSLLQDNPEDRPCASDLLATPLLSLYSDC